MRRHLWLTAVVTTQPQTPHLDQQEAGSKSREASRECALLPQRTMVKSDARQGRSSCSAGGAVLGHRSAVPYTMPYTMLRGHLQVSWSPFSQWELYFSLSCILGEWVGH